MIDRKIILVLFVLCTGIQTYAQSPFYFTGYGRALIGKSQYSEKSSFVQNDTTNQKQSLDGSFIFDMGVNVRPSEELKANAILRFSNEFGGFYGSGSLMNFRQIQIQGLLARKVLFNVGDMDLSLTKYTLFNPFDPTYSEFEAEGFKIRRGIVEYENFNFGNKWRLQGMQASTTVNFKKVIEAVNFSAFGTRTIPSNFLNTPDRLFLGGVVKVRQSKFLELGGNVAAMTDIAGTVQDTVVFYKNTVVSGDYKISLSSRTFNFTTYGEVGRSFYDMNLVEAETRVKKIDGFFDVGASAAHRYIPLSLNVSYRLVGPDFSSPGAQTRRVFDNQYGVLLPEGKDTLQFRRLPNIFDRMSDLNLYNRSLSTVLMYFDPVYNNSTPYGFATPNRKGFNVDLKYGNKDSLLYININAQLLSEVLGTGVKDKRNFILINPGATFNFNKLLKVNRLMALSAALRYEKTKGSEATGIDFTSMMLDGSLTVETLKRLDLIGGVKYLDAGGREFLAIRNVFNEITNYFLYEPDVTQMVYSGGLRYRFTDQIFMSANVFMSNVKYADFPTYDYQINQYYFSYIMKF